MKTLAAALIGLACSGCHSGDPNARELPGEKSEWSVLQVADASSQTVGGPVITTVGGYEVLRVAGRDGRPVSILLKPEAPPFYKQIPAESNYTVPGSLVQRLARQDRVGYTVEMVLMSRADSRR